LFCYQCQETVKGQGCSTRGVCGKDSQVAALQDLLVHKCKEIARDIPASDSRNRAVDRFLTKALFATLTNVNFDAGRFQELLQQAEEIKEQNRAATGETAEPSPLRPAHDLAGLVRQGEEVGIERRKDKLGDEVAGLQELVLYGLKGVAAYAYHASVLGKESNEVYDFIRRTLAFLTREDTTSAELLTTALEVGRVNLVTMALLDQANTERYGHPEPTRVRITPRKGKAILVTGHDLKDLEDVLEQTRGTGINVYTHGEMLPCNAYPGLKEYPHLVGNHGGAWWEQTREFDEFPGAILVTTNCVQEPRDSYRGRLFTTHVVGLTGVAHISDGDFSPLIDAALAAPGFAEDGEDRSIVIGFAHKAVLGLADKVVKAVKSGAIRHFFLVGGCDGRHRDRQYYTRFAQAVPDDCVIVTLGCGKYRFNKLDFGEIDGIPRLLDCGQCNDAYSAIQIAVALAEAFGTDVNGLPLSLNVSWYEQKAVAILLTLLHLGIRNIRLGPSLPAFLAPAVVKVLVEKFDLAPIGTPEEDLKAMLA